MSALPRRTFVALAAGAAGSALTPAASATTRKDSMIAYVGSRTTAERQGHGRGIGVHTIDDRGRWNQIQLVETVNPTYLALDATQQFLYAVHGDLTTVSAYAIEPAGTLRAINEQDTAGKNPAHIVVDPTNRHVLVTNHSSGSVATLPIRPDGGLGPVTSLFETSGTPGPHRGDQTGPKPHQAVFDHTGKCVIIPDKGLDRVFVTTFDPTTGRLSASSSVATREMAGPRHIAFHPTLPYAYTIDELRSTVTTYHWEAGTLTPLQVLPSHAPTFTGDTRAGEIIVDRAGHHVYATNRSGAGDSTPGGPDPDTIGLYRIDHATGTLTPMGWCSTQGIRPRFACFDPDGAMFYAANERSDNIVAFRADDDQLTPTGEVVSTGSPVCIAFRTVPT